MFTATIHILTGNFLPSDADASEGINMEASIAKYCEIVKSALEASMLCDIVFRVQNAEGSSLRTSIVWEDADNADELSEDDESILYTIASVEEKTFTDGAFWINAE